MCDSADSNHQMCFPREIQFTTPQAAQITLGSGPGLLWGGLSALAVQAGPVAELRCNFTENNLLLPD